MQINLSSKTALVGASTQGIGYGIARELAASGANVFLMSRDEEKLKLAVQSLPVADAGQQHGYVVADFNDFQLFKGVIEKFLQQTPIDILVNNTQGPKAGKASDLQTADYSAAFDLLFKVVVETTALALKGMMKNKWGRIINVSSVSVTEPIDKLALSNSIRAATAGWAKTLANELGQYNITVNNILTGYFDTERIAKMIHEESLSTGSSVEVLRNERADKVPLKRLGRPEEYGYLATFLASDYAAYITGTNIPLDGGLSKSY